MELATLGLVEVVAAAAAAAAGEVVVVVEVVVVEVVALLKLGGLTAAAAAAEPLRMSKMLVPTGLERLGLLKSGRLKGPALPVVELPESGRLNGL